MVFLIQNGIFDPLKIWKFEKKNEFKMSILWVFLRKFSEFGSKISKFIQKLPKFYGFLVKNQKIKKTDFFLQKITFLLQNLNEFGWKFSKFIQKNYQKIFYVAKIPLWSYSWYFAKLLNFEIFWDFFKYFRFWSWIGNFWVVSISGIRIYFCFLGFTLVP